MPRIPDADLENLKRNVSVEAVCRSHGIELTRHGSKDLKAKCPFHDDAEASFIVSPDKNLWHCLGCDKGGSVIDLVMQLDGLDFRQAVDKIILSTPAVIRASDLPAATESPPNAPPNDPSAPSSENPEENNALMKRVVEYYHQTLFKQGNALQYLQERGIHNPEALRRFKIGSANRTLFAAFDLQNNRKLRERLQTLGICRDSGHEHLNGCVTFPIQDEDGHILGLYGRRICKPTHDAPKHLYLPGPHRGVWNADGLRDAKDWILCEAIIDALSFWVHGFTNVTASYGVHGFTPDHWTLLRRLRPRRVLIAYDNDPAGHVAANELTQKLEAEDFEAWRVELPVNADVNELIRTRKNPKEELQSFLVAAVRMLPALSPIEATVATVPTTVAPVSANEAAKESATQEQPSPPLPVPTSSPCHADGASKTDGELRILHKGAMSELDRGDRHYRMRGLDKNTSLEHLKLTVRINVGDRFHLDTFDLYNARNRVAFIAAANQVTGAAVKTLEDDMTVILSQLERFHERQVLDRMKASTPAGTLEKRPVMTPEDEQKALALLREPDIFARLLADFVLIGAVGEETNKLVGYLVTVSRKLDDPLSAIIISRSAAGKSALLNSLLDFVPAEDKEVLTSMTAQALFYLPPDGLKHKVLALAEDEGSERAAYPLKILQSEKVLVLAVTVKDPETGAMYTKMKQVDGPASQIMTSTQAELDYEIANRYLVLTVDEDREQTERIHQAQREGETLHGVLKKLDKEHLLLTHHNAQRLLRPLRVVNPFAHLLTFPTDRLRLRRDHMKYLGLIRTMAFLRQYQKEIKTCVHRGKAVQYIEVDETDLRQVHPLTAKILGRSLDELTPPVRAFLLELYRQVVEVEKIRNVRRDKVRLTQREIREFTKWSEAQVRRYLAKLVELEYVLQHRVPGTAARYEYELVYDGQGQDGQTFVPGLADIEAVLARHYDPESSSEQAQAS